MVAQHLNHGLLYHSARYFVAFLRHVNLVELFKWSGGHFARRLKVDSRYGEAVGVDAYQVFKWILLILIWNSQTVNRTHLLIVFYMIGSNLFSYFYYHCWVQHNPTLHAFRRRLIHAIFAILYYICLLYTSPSPRDRG